VAIIVITMKPHTINAFGKSALCAACLILAAGLADAKPDKDKGGNGGKGGQSEKQKGGDKKGDKGKPDKDAHKDDKKHDKEAAKWKGDKFRDDDRDGVLRYFSEYKGNDRGLPPGLAKNLRRGKTLPPGWQDKVNEGYVIEDGWRENFYPMEYSMFPSLRPAPDTRLYLFGNRLVRVYEPTRQIIDVITISTILLD
jgi:hypothetical protein